MTTSFIDAPGQKFVTPTQSDSTADPAGPFRAIYVGGSGDVKITDLHGNAATFIDLAAGILHPICCTRIWTTGTDATNILCVPMNDHVQ